MIFSYYPGCTLKTKGKELDIYARKSAEALGVTMEELEEWQCCGAVYPMASDEIASRLSAIRALDSAKKKGQKLLTLLAGLIIWALLTLTACRRAERDFEKQDL